MANFTTLKPTVIVTTGLGLLARELTLPQLVWLNAVGDFAGAFNDTISIRVPAYATARTRVLRSGSARTRDSMSERKVDLTLDTDVYKDVVITDEELSLDIVNFGTQVLNPVMSSIARKMEDVLAATITGATYQKTVAMDPLKPFTAFVAARKALNDFRVPFSGRAVVCGSSVEAYILESEQFARYDHAGDTDALREAKIGRVAGFDVYTSPALDPDEAYAFHKSAFVMSTRAPIVPAGAPYGASVSSDGFAMRVVRVLDSATIEDILAVDSWVGTAVVTDRGEIDNGIFEPSENPADSDSGDLFVRAVKIDTLGS